MILRKQYQVILDGSRKLIYEDITNDDGYVVVFKDYNYDETQMSEGYAIDNSSAKLPHMIREGVRINAVFSQNILQKYL